MHMPEDMIIRQGENEYSIYFIAEGLCTVKVQNHMRIKVKSNELVSGDFFGELSFLFGVKRTADV